ncbi:uncharacterized protein LOC129004475 [Macrosteles quadrilineatus]|uniref:uncharacterized protein LOC129004475 n=1 Tax=Macrosteles quadrilineatus TaxID=74068 RepID=UPI0023E0EF9B|nr:uncharacterized protein LOC129004475 [Macrosteles quadrilineatus]
MGKPRPLAHPEVDEVQYNLHQRLLNLEPVVLQHSLRVSKMAQWTTEESYRKTYEAAGRIDSLAEDLDKLAKHVRPVAPNCVDFKRLKKAKQYFEKTSEDMYVCTHSLSDIAASFEVEMTEKIVAARAQIMDIKQAMWFCQKYQPEIDQECLQRLNREGELVLAKLPERARMVEDKARAARMMALEKQEDCLVEAISAAEECHLEETEAITECYQKSQEVESESQK